MTRLLHLCPRPAVPDELHELTKDAAPLIQAPADARGRPRRRSQLERLPHLSEGAERYTRHAPSGWGARGMSGREGGEGRCFAISYKSRVMRLVVSAGRAGWPSRRGGRERQAGRQQTGRGAGSAPACAESAECSQCSSGWCGSRNNSIARSVRTRQAAPLRRCLACPAAQHCLA